MIVYEFICEAQNGGIPPFGRKSCTFKNLHQAKLAKQALEEKLEIYHCVVSNDMHSCYKETKDGESFMYKIQIYEREIVSTTSGTIDFIQNELE